MLPTNLPAALGFLAGDSTGTRPRFLVSLGNSKLRYRTRWRENAFAWLATFSLADC
jgi:hypothetical protein